MSTSLAIKLNKKEHKRLQELAFSYGFSIDKLVRHILASVTQTLMDIPKESLNEYDNPEEIKRDFKNALREYRAGKFHTKL